MKTTKKHVTTNPFIHLLYNLSSLFLARKKEYRNYGNVNNAMHLNLMMHNTIETQKTQTYFLNGYSIRPKRCKILIAFFGIVDYFLSYHTQWKYVNFSRIHWWWYKVFYFKNKTDTGFKKGLKKKFIFFWREFFVFEKFEFPHKKKESLFEFPFEFAHNFLNNSCYFLDLLHYPP